MSRHYIHQLRGQHSKSSTRIREPFDPRDVSGPSTPVEVTEECVGEGDWEKSLYF